jgi:hypothetical protein
MANSRFPGALSTDCYGVTAAEARVAHLSWSATEAAAASTTAIHAAYLNTHPQQGATCTVAAAAETGSLVIKLALETGAAGNGLSINLTTAADDVLAVSAVQSTGVITIALAKTTPANNTAANVQAAIRNIATGLVKAVDITTVTCTAVGNWDTQAVATGETAAVAFTGGIDGAADVVTTKITQPSCPRNITATSGGTEGDIKVGQVIIYGTNMKDEVITETLPVFTVNSATTVVGAKAFKTVTAISFPPHDGATDWTVSRATVSIGVQDVLGLPFLLTEKSAVMTCVNNAIDSAATVTTSTTAIESNTLDPNASLAGTPIDAYIFL